jgi:hypothetical protein
VTAVRGWMANIDWSNDGTFGGTLEDVTNYVDRQDITMSWGRSVDGIQVDTEAGEAQFHLFNRGLAWDRYFSPENTSSPIYGKILPGKKTAISKTVRGQSTILTETWSSSGAGVNGWAAQSGGTASRVASPSEDGNGSLQYVPPGAVATVGVARTATSSIATEPDGTYVVTFRVLSNTTWSDLIAAADWYDSAGALIGSTNGPTLAATSGVWTTIQGTLTPPALSVAMRPRLRIGSTPANTMQINVDNADVTSVPNDAGKTYMLHAGILDDFGVDATAVARTFSGTSLDAWGRPNGTSLSTAVYTGVRTGDAIGVVLDAMGWTGPRAVDPGATVIPYWWEQDSSPSDAIKKLVCSEGPPAIAYVEAGTFVFRDRHHRIRTSATSVATFSHIVPAGPAGTDYKIEKDTFQYDHGLKSIVNSVTFSVDVRRPAALQEVWTQEDPIAMVGGTSMVVFAKPSDGVINAIAPDTAAGDIQSDSGAFTATIDRTSGQSFVITLSCSSSGTLTRLALRGMPLTVARTVQITSSDAGSIGRYGGANDWPSDFEPVWANRYDAQALADRIVAVNADNRPRITFTVVAFNDRYTSAMLRLRISDRITVRNDVLGVNADFHVERLEHTVSRLTTHRLTISAVRAEPTQPANAFTFDGAGKGFDQGLFATAGIDSASTMFVFDLGGQGFDQGVFAT